ncbi:MAG: PEGA domain-containing protein [Actinobacteria bacterium]|nr:PEGA domain-containing protein [Actinomycetota bacterium]
MKVFFSLLIFIVIFSCTTQDGILESEKQKFGSLFITCNVDSAQIYLDQNPTGKFTSSTDSVLLDSVKAGAHSVQLQRECYETLEPESNIVIQAGKQARLYIEMKLLDSVSNLFISTTPDSALIFLDGLPRGYSPVFLNCVAAGEHSFEIRKGSYAPVTAIVTAIGGETDTLQQSLALQRTVLVEHFSSSTCVPCVTADEAISSFLQNNGVARVVSINYHTEIPAPGDPMYLAAKEDNDARMTYYKIFTNPIVWFDGVISELGTSNLDARLENAFQTRTIVLPKAAMEILHFKKSNDMVSGTIRVEALSELQNIKLQIAVVEKNVDYENPPGQNGQKHFFDVLRTFYPTPDGTLLSLPVDEKTFIQFSLPSASQWKTVQLEVIAFLQDQDTKEVLQAASTLYP